MSDSCWMDELCLLKFRLVLCWSSELCACLVECLVMSGSLWETLLRMAVDLVTAVLGGAFMYFLDILDDLNLVMFSMF